MGAVPYKNIIMLNLAKVRQMSLNACKLINIPKIIEHRGNLSFIEGKNHIPFEIMRVYYLYDVPGGTDRGSHAHKKLQQLLVSVSGSFDVELDDGKEKKRIHLNRPYHGLYISSMVWRKLDNFSSGSVCMVLASAYYDKVDYIRDYEEFLKLVK